MKTLISGRLAILMALPLFLITTLTVRSQVTAFTYQGSLNAGGSPANGSFNFTFTLYATNSSGVPVAGPITNLVTTVANGLFTTTVDFGTGIFNGTNYWLEIAAETNGVGPFITLAPRQQITSAPYATFANTASNLLGQLPAAQLSGPVPLTSLPTTSLVTNGQAGVNFSGYFTGDGRGLTNLPVAAAVSNSLASAPFFGPTRLIFDGDSLTFGANSGGNSYPQWLQQVFYAGNNNITLFTNAAVSGATIENMQSRFLGTVAPLAPSGGTNAFDFVWCGSNDLVEQLNNDSGVESLLSNYWSTARSHGFKVVAFTISDRLDFPNYLTIEGYRNSINQWIRENPQLYDYLVDVDKMYPSVSTNYQSDGIHFTTQCLYVIAKGVYYSLIANTVDRVVPSLVGSNLFVLGNGVLGGRLNVGATNSPLLNATAQGYVDGLVNINGNAPGFAMTRTNNYQWLSFIDGNNCLNNGNFSPNFATYFIMSPAGRIAFGNNVTLNDSSPPFQVIEPTAQFSGTVIATNGFATAGGTYAGNGSGLTNLVSMLDNETSSVTFNANGNSETDYHLATATMASLTIHLPAVSIPGEIVRFVSAAPATTVAVSGTVSIGPALSTLDASSCVAWQAVNYSGSWVRIQ